MIILTSRVLMKVLLTCFEPFGNNKVNVSSIVAKHFATSLPRGYDLIVKQLPVSFERVGNILSSIIELHKPNIVIMLGQAGNREKISIERIAINLMDSKMGDNDNFYPCELPIIPSKENALFSNMPLKDIIKKWHEAGIDAIISNSAGLYVCNCSFYHALSLSSKIDQQMKVGFLHLPKLPTETALHNAIICEITKAISIIIEICLK